ncbi:MAG: hypothetical protein ICV68_01115 [Pyrinomonadaceae bacterium]|nr:hypothetical protein [Pyrinomonadaceae bacterium]
MWRQAVALRAFAGRTFSALFLHQNGLPYEKMDDSGRAFARPAPVIESNAGASQQD